MIPGGTRLCPFVIPSAVEESLAILEIIRDVSVRAGLAYSLDMTGGTRVVVSQTFGRRPTVEVLWRGRQRGALQSRGAAATRRSI